MNAAQRTHRVELSCVGTPPTRQIERAAGVSQVEVDGRNVRCLVTGSFQPFLEALRGHEVITLESTPSTESIPATRDEGDL
jgi:hypothetical protein